MAMKRIIRSSIQSEFVDDELTLTEKMLIIIALSMRLFNISLPPLHKKPSCLPFFLLTPNYPFAIWYFSRLFQPFVS